MPTYDRTSPFVDCIAPTRLPIAAKQNTFDVLGTLLLGMPYRHASDDHLMLSALLQDGEPPAVDPHGAHGNGQAGRRLRRVRVGLQSMGALRIHHVDRHFMHEDLPAKFRGFLLERA